ncbi:MAG: cation transporter [Ignavibacteriae bacterium]|nr:cation transporter [Ignavibacteriota bacterium]MCB9215012.1 cation transporter [Ignavibacteria bacterium]
MNRASLTRYAWLSIAAAILTIGLKTGAWLITDSVGLLSDALESVVNLAAAIFALVMLTVAARPPDEDHMFGHDKAEYFSSGMEGGLIVVAAVGIAIPAVNRLFAPQPIEQVDLGLILSSCASVINLAVARILLRVGKRERSLTLEADGHHLMTDVWTSVAVLSGVGVVVLTGWDILDPLIGLAVALHIIGSGTRLVWRSAHGLMDKAIPDEQRGEVEVILGEYHQQGLHYHALRTRQSGGRSFVSFHLLVPGGWTVQQGHDLAEEIEEKIRAALPSGVSIFTHLEPIEDPLSWEDVELYRKPGESP